VREILPLRIAADLGATQIFAIGASAPGIRLLDEPTFARRSIIDIAARCQVEIALDEILRDETHAEREAAQARTVVGTRQVVRPGLGGGPGVIVNLPTTSRVSVTLIEPRINLHDIMTVNPDFITINMAYGYMCAADVVTNQRTDRAGTAEDIVTMFLALKAEERSAMPNAGNVTAFRRILQDNLQARGALGLAIPPGSSGW
jgi:hypothetical protein